MTKETEVQHGSADVASVLKYIAEREENLGKYSDKLRTNVQRIFDIFGDPYYCQICGKSVSRAHGKYRARIGGNKPTWMPEAADTVPELYARLATPEDGASAHIGNETLWEENPDNHTPLPRIRVSIEMRSKIFYDDGDAQWYLDLDRKGLSFGVETPRGEGIRSAEDAPRKVLNEVIRTGTLTQFLKDIADALKEEQDEYQEVAEMAERMAQAISS